jgi:hypothetical protein
MIDLINGLRTIDLLIAYFLWLLAWKMNQHQLLSLKQKLGTNLEDRLWWHTVSKHFQHFLGSSLIWEWLASNTYREPFICKYRKKKSILRLWTKQCDNKLKSLIPLAPCESDYSNIQHTHPSHSTSWIYIVCCQVKKYINFQN